MRTILTTFLLTTVFALPAMSQVDPDPDGVGIYADLGATINRADLVYPETMDLYLLLTNPSDVRDIIGFEVSIDGGGFQILDVDYAAASAVNTGSDDEYIVSFADMPLPSAPVVLLMTLTVQSTTGGGWGGIVLDCIDWPYGGSLGNYRPGYTVGTNKDYQLLDMNQSSGRRSEPVFRFNGPAPIAVEHYTFGGIKALFR